MQQLKCDVPGVGRGQSRSSHRLPGLRPRRVTVEIDLPVPVSQCQTSRLRGSCRSKGTVASPEETSRYKNSRASPPPARVIHPGDSSGLFSTFFCVQVAFPVLSGLQYLAWPTKRSMKKFYSSVQQQKGGSDCGVFAIAFAFDIAQGVDPQYVNYTQTEMRKHLKTCLQQDSVTAFPRNWQSAKRRVIRCRKILDELWSSVTNVTNGFILVM